MTRRLPAGLSTAVLLVTAWLICDPLTPDLAAQTYRVHLFDHSGLIVFDTYWYGGHTLPGYSLLFPVLASLLGMRVLAAAAVIVSSAIFERLTDRAYGRTARWGSVAFALAATGDIWSGRLTFALGVSLALAAVLALYNSHTALGALLALLCTAASPVAGVLLALAAVTHAFATRSYRIALAVIVPALALPLTLALAFPEGGYEPFPVLSFLATALVTVGFYWALPGSRRELRIGAVLYLAVCTASLLLHTPMGSNIERYGVLLAAPLLLCVLATQSTSAFTFRRILILAGMLVWIIWGPVRETAAVLDNPSTDPSYYLPVERFMAHQGGLVRVEVPLTRGHWEAAWLARDLPLARGWEKQLDERYDSVLLSGGLDAQSYERWLREQAVGYVALPDVALDPSSAREGALIRHGLPYLRLVDRSAHWRIYRFLDARPMAEGPGRLTALTHDSFTVNASARGRMLVRIHYTSYWKIVSGVGCVTSAPGGWTAVTARRPGRMVVAARFSLGRAFGGGGVCRG
jgi:hypothetical protein